MKKLILNAASAALAMGLLATSMTASSAESRYSPSTTNRYPAWMKMMDMNKDSMVSKEEFMNAMSTMYDEKMTKMKGMSATDQAKMMKDDQMTSEGLRSLQRDLLGGGR